MVQKTVKPLKQAEKKSRAFAQLLENLLQQIYICALHAKLICTLVGAYCNVDLVALDRFASVLSDEHAVAPDEYAAAERNDGRSTAIVRPSVRVVPVAVSARLLPLHSTHGS